MDHPFQKIILLIANSGKKERYREFCPGSINEWRNYR